MATRQAEPDCAEARRMPSGRRLSSSERVRLAVEIVCTYLRVRSAMSRSPIAVAVADLRGRPASDSPSSATEAAPDALVEARRLGGAVTRTLALVPGDTRCLARSLVLTRLLATRGVPSTLVIGARAAPSFLAHAWVECVGVPVLPPGDGSFGRLVEL